MAYAIGTSGVNKFTNYMVIQTGAKVNLCHQLITVITHRLMM